MLAAESDRLIARRPPGREGNGLTRAFPGRLFHSYLAQQHFDRELAELPGSDAPPLGALLITEHGGVAIGCLGVKPLELPDVCDMKRLFVRLEGRGLGAGHALVDHVLRVARDAGYGVVRLDTLPSMQDAQRLYRAFGFVEIPPYNANHSRGICVL